MLQWKLCLKGCVLQTVYFSHCCITMRVWRCTYLWAHCCYWWNLSDDQDPHLPSATILATNFWSLIQCTCLSMPQPLHTVLPIATLLSGSENPQNNWFERVWQIGISDPWLPLPLSTDLRVSKSVNWGSVFFLSVIETSPTSQTRRWKWWCRSNKGTDLLVNIIPVYLLKAVVMFSLAKAYPHLWP